MPHPVVGPGNHNDVCDVRVGHNHVLEFCWGNLEPLVLDQLLEPVRQVGKSVVVDGACVRKGASQHSTNSLAATRAEAQITLHVDTGAHR